MSSGTGDDSPSESDYSSAPSKSMKDKHTLKAPRTIASLRSPGKLLSFKPINSRPKSETHSPPGRPRSPSPSAIVIGSNEDILTQILLYLPPKSLVRFQCVCKKWFSLISSPHFRLLHTSQSPTASPSSSPNTSGLFLYRIIFRSLELNSFSLADSEACSMGIITSRFSDFLDVHGEILNLHSCNGLFCLDFLWEFEVRRLCVYNPTTHEYRLVVWHDINQKFGKLHGVNMVFNPLKPDHFKIVCPWTIVTGMVEDSEELEQGHEQFGFFVYSSKTQAWKEYLDIEVPDKYFYLEQGVFLNGKLYWTGIYRSLLCFDAENDCFRYLSCGPKVFRGDILYFGESMGNLHLIEAVQSDLLEVLEWEENLEHGGWFVRNRVNLSFLSALYPLMLKEDYSPPFENRFAFGILCFQVDEEGKKAKLIISSPGKIISCEMNDMAVEELVDIEPAHLQFLQKNMSWYVWKNVHKHIETLACV